MQTVVFNKSGLKRKDIAEVLGNFRDKYFGSRNCNLPTSEMQADTNRAWLQVAFDTPRKTYPMPVAHWKTLGMK